MGNSIFRTVQKYYLLWKGRFLQGCMLRFQPSHVDSYVDLFNCTTVSESSWQCWPWPFIRGFMPDHIFDEALPGSSHGLSVSEMFFTRFSSLLRHSNSICFIRFLLIGLQNLYKGDKNVYSFKFWVSARVVLLSLKRFHGHFCQTPVFENHKGNSFAVIMELWALN